MSEIVGWTFCWGGFIFFSFFCLPLKLVSRAIFRELFTLSSCEGIFREGGRAGGGNWCVARLIAAAAEMRRVSERRKRKRDYATTVQWMWQWQWQWHGSDRGRSRGEMELLRRRRWRRYMVTDTHTLRETHRHMLARTHATWLAGCILLTSFWVFTRSLVYSFRLSAFTFFSFCFFLFVFFWAWLSSDVSWCCCWQCCFCVDCCSCQPAASCLVFAVAAIVVVVAFVLLFKLFRLFSCVMARLCAIFISSKWISHPLPAQWSSCSQLLFVLLF